MSRRPSDHIAAPTHARDWNGWLSGLADCTRERPWPFPVSTFPGLGLVRNVTIAAAPKAKPRGRRVEPCAGADRSGIHLWRTARKGVAKADEVCRACGRTRAQVRIGAAA